MKIHVRLYWMVTENAVESTVPIAFQPDQIVSCENENMFTLQLARIMLEHASEYESELILHILHFRLTKSHGKSYSRLCACKPMLQYIHI